MPGGSQRLCRGTVRKRSIFSIEGGGNEEAICAFISAQLSAFSPSFAYICNVCVVLCVQNIVYMCHKSACARMSCVPVHA